MLRCSRILFALSLLALAGTTARGASDKTWLLDQNNWEIAEGLLPPPVLERVKKGDYWFRVHEVDPARFRRNYSERFWQASEANDGKYDLAPDVCGLVDRATGKMPEFFFGLPFPRISKDDPRAGCKIAWNFVAASMQGEGGGATFTINGIDRGGEFRHIKVGIHVMTYLGRHGGPIPNPQGLRSAAMVFLHEPKDIEGVSFLALRKNDWYSNDKIWGYIPATRRVRRLNSATRSDPIAGMDIFAEDGNCYSGKVEYYDWKLVGEGEVLAPVLGPYAFPMRPVTETRFAVDIPYMKGVYETPGAKGAPWLVAEHLVYVPRKVWIVEGESNDPEYNFSKSVFYFDKELFQIHWKLVYNRAGEYFYNAACGHHFARKDDGTFTAVANDIVIGVNDKTDRAAFGGRYTSHFIERRFPENHFTLQTLRQSD
ncbi:MAG: hypothetical protein KatS3mg076_1448 [Candidatus Binatia bacterium]|nr:MAG: hypothetical protein KatS3mg076_1448 [Candidatus Binatia bacterium]